MAAASTGCTPDCNREYDVAPLEYRDGIIRETSYSSGPVAGPGVPFGPGERVEFHHGLGAPPTVQLAYLAFTSCSTDQECAEGEPSGTGFTLSSGDATVFEDVNAQTVVVRNNTCADFFLRVELRDPEQQ